MQDPTPVPSLPRLMLVTDAAAVETRVGEERLAAAIRGGVGIVQLRDRAVGAGELLVRARAIRRLVPETPLLVNDRVDVALAAGAAGVQLGAAALPLTEVRRLMGEQALIGRSVHTVAEAVAAAEDGADYLIVGTIYPTATHPDKAPEGPELLQAVAAAVRIPFFAIGGITPETAGECIRRGAHGVAVIRAISAASDPEQAARRLGAAVREAVGRCTDGCSRIPSVTASAR